MHVLFRHHMIDTAIGWIGIAWTDAGLAAVQLPERDRAATLRRLLARLASPSTEDAAPGPAIGALSQRIRAHSLGETVDHSQTGLDLAGVDDFRRDIYSAASGLRFGETTTYGELARQAGHPGKAREAGEALGRNPVPLVVPCHRILAAGGRLGGFSAPGGSATKAKLLSLEGVRLGPPPPPQAAFAF